MGAIKIPLQAAGLEDPSLRPRVQFDSVSIDLAGRTLLRNVSFTLAAGERAGIRGRSGAGKSTLLKALLGLHRPSSGRILIDGQPLSRESLRAIRSCIAYIGQEPLLGAETVREALLLPFTFKAHRAETPTEVQLKRALSRLGLADSLLSAACSRVSGGEKQRIAIARAQLLGKQLYLLDEVTSGLDDSSRMAVIELFNGPGTTVLSVSHDPVWIAHCTAVFDLVDGRLTLAT